MVHVRGEEPTTVRMDIWTHLGCVGKLLLDRTLACASTVIYARQRLPADHLFSVCEKVYMRASRL